ncbi:MAG: hypothetical protein ACTSVS_09685 [Candidatus Heimdallarchaeota archaeon]
MPLNQEKTLKIILNQCKNIEERCQSYRKEILNAVAEILILESQHRIRGTNIQQQINDKCNATGQFLERNAKAN